MAKTTKLTVAIVSTRNMAGIVTQFGNKRVIWAGTGTGTGTGAGTGDWYGLESFRFIASLVMADGYFWRLVD
jgi:hypothetical protein